MSGSNNHETDVVPENAKKVSPKVSPVPRNEARDYGVVFVIPFAIKS